MTIENELMQFWAPHLGQVAIVQALFRKLTRYIFLQCGRKFGKTEFAIFCMYLWAILFPDSQIYYIADTMKHAGELVWKNGRLPFFFLKPKKGIFEPMAVFQQRRKIGQALHDKYILRENNSEMRLYFKNGSWIKIDGAENYANADGIEPDFMVYDEFKSHNPKFHEAMEPNLRVKKAPLLIVGTPPEELGTYYEKIAKQFKNLEYAEHFLRPSYMNNILYPKGKDDPEFKEEWNKYIARGDEDVAERELLAKIVVSGSKAIFPVLELPEFDDQTGKYIGTSKHVKSYETLVKEIKRTPKDWDFHAVYDAGSVTCFAVLIAAVNRYDKRVVLLDEIYETDQRHTTTRRIYPRSLDKCAKIYDYHPSWEKTYDSAATWFMNEVLDVYGDVMMPSTKDLKNKESKLSQIKDLLIWGKLIVSDKCIKMLWEMSSYRKDEHGRIPKENDHLIDCLRYLLNACHYDFAEVEKMVEEKRVRGHQLTYEREMVEYNTSEHNYGQLQIKETYEY